MLKTEVVLGSEPGVAVSKLAGMHCHIMEYTPGTVARGFPATFHRIYTIMCKHAANAGKSPRLA